MASFNRRDTTLRCLRSLFSQQHDGLALSVHLLDDASSDGTAEAVRTTFPDVEVINGDGQRFWGRGMFEAMSAANTRSYDFLLWLNDDVDLLPSALDQLIAYQHAAARAAPGSEHIIVGSMQDPVSGSLTYSGFKSVSRFHPARLSRVTPTDGELTPCDTMNGNCVLVPAGVVKKIGLIDPTFVQQLGDIDYGYRAKRAGIRLWVTPHPVGKCEPNLKPARWQDPSLGAMARLRLLNTPHGLPIRPWSTFMWRYAGPLGLVLLVGSYVKAFLPRRAAAVAAP